MSESKTFARFKYAEEFANGLHNQGHHFTLTNAFDVDHEENGEHYTYDEFTVEWET